LDTIEEGSYRIVRVTTPVKRDSRLSHAGKQLDASYDCKFVEANSRNYDR